MIGELSNLFLGLYGSLKLTLELHETMLNNKTEYKKCRKGDVKDEQWQKG